MRQAPFHPPVLDLKSLFKLIYSTFTKIKGFTISVKERVIVYVRT